jgi:integrase
MKSGRWQARYTAADGSMVPAPSTFRKKVDAEAFLVDRRREADQALWAGTRPQPMKFSDYAARWLIERRTAGRPLKPYTHQQYRNILRDHLLPEFGDQELASITSTQVREWHAALLPDSPAMRARVYRLLHTVMTSAFSDELVAVNPCRLKGASSAEQVHRAVPATLAELATAAAAMPPRLQLAVPLSGWLGLRFGELSALQRRDFDLHAEVLHVRRGVVQLDDGFHVDTPKSRAGIRDIAIPPHLIEAIEQHLDTYVAPGQDSLLFPADLATPLTHITSGAFMYRWKIARKAAGRDDLRWHDLRHTGSTLAALAGASLSELMTRMGHSTPGAALRYLHTAQGRDREIAQLLSKLADNEA